ncbi:O-antigen ligase family protein [Sphingomonas sp. BN140010]|uniref:O-antigen ligase family protein n=1 Tax=Sphingomonas arvum TaxID=2992113 RepID=A0ABT3JDU6_9SPHN|nr:O-antigen ligase family protein [Sphingomonas sp. BN140010]MCW3796991.1 O-antigen ligase family protein [Sphingomonas sp. BN140010]
MADLASPAFPYGQPRHLTLAPRGGGSSAGAAGRGFAAAAFAALLTATIALNAYRVGGVPIRGLAVIAVLGIATLAYLDVAKRVLEENLLLLGLAAGLATLGIFVSLVNGAPLLDVLRAVVEVHIQAAATIMVAAILARVAGARASAMIIVGVIGVSALVAVAQAMDIAAAWRFRRALGPLPTEAIEGLNFLDRRPVGLSFSPISLATHLCLALATFLAVRSKLRGLSSSADPLVVPAFLAFCAACIACATRSPILGGFIFLAAYTIQRRASWLILFLIVGAAVVYLAWPLLVGFIETAAPRVLRTDDNSAEARSTLVYYGLRLFADNPLGYGLTFAPMTMWQPYWADLYMMQAPQGTRENDLHNYLVNMVNIYGIGLLLFAPVMARLLWRSRATLIFFIPYLVHIFFHNYGPFYNDNVIWFVIAAIAAAASPHDEGGIAQRASRTAAFARPMRPIR